MIVSNIYVNTFDVLIPFRYCKKSEQVRGINPFCKNKPSWRGHILFLKAGRKKTLSSLLYKTAFPIQYLTFCKQHHLCFPWFFSSFVYYCEMYNHGYFLMHYFFLLGHLIRAMHLSEKEKSWKWKKKRKKRWKLEWYAPYVFLAESLSCEFFLNFQSL